MADLRGQQLKDSFDQILTKGEGNRLIEDGEGNQYFYEKNNWTPELKIDGNTAGITYSEQYGKYIKAGDLVVLTAQIILTSKGGHSGNIRILGIPFNAAPVRTPLATGRVNGCNTPTMPFIQAENNSLMRYYDPGPGSSVVLDGDDIGDDFRIDFSGSYVI